MIRMRTTRRVLYTIATICIGAGCVLRFVPSVLTQNARADEPGQRIAEQKRIGETVARENTQFYGFKGVIKGCVRLKDGKPVPGIYVRTRFTRHQSGARGENFAVTDADGNYEILGLNPQSFRVWADNSGTPYITEPDRLIALDTMPNVTAAKVDFTLTLGPKITIRVHDAQTNEPIAGVAVRATRFPDGTSNPIKTTNDRGEYQFWANSLVTDITLEPGKHNGYQVWEAPGSPLFRRIAFKSPAEVKDVDWDVKTYSPDPALFNVRLRGTVSDPHGRPVDDAEVRLVRGTRIESARTKKDGSFVIPTERMQTGEYGKWDKRIRKGFLIEARKGSLSAFHFADPEETWTQIPIRLERENGRATVTGQVVGTDGKPIAGVPIHYSESFLDDAYSDKNAEASDAQGRFTIRGLSDDAYYQFRFGKPAQNGNDFGFGVTRLPTAEYTLGFLRLKSGEKRDLGRVVVLRADAVLSGKIVTPSGGIPEGDFLVVIKGDHTAGSVHMDAQGNFYFPSVVRETLRLNVFAPDKDGGYSWGPDRPGKAGWRTIRFPDKPITIILN